MIIATCEMDPLDDPGYQRFLAEAAIGCAAKHRPCPGCVAGGVCDDDDDGEDMEWDDDEEG